MTLRRTLQRSLSTTTRGLLQFGSGGGAPSYDTDAQTYITAVETADGQSLETGVKDAINAFVVGCKADGIWTAIKASCILAGARTLTGALVPLVGTAPTNNNFVSGDYSRTAGLTGNGSTKYLNSNRAGNADPSDSSHLVVYVTTNRITSNAGYIGSDSTNSCLFGNTTGARARVNSATVLTLGTGTSVPSLVATSRSSSTAFDWMALGQSGTQSETALTQGAVGVAVFARAIGLLPSNATIAFYSIGESLDLALLDSRVTNLITDIGTALA